MDTKDPGPERHGWSRRWMGGAGLVGAGLLAGGILAGSHIAGAATATSASTSATTAASNGHVDPATVGHGPGETLLTDGTAARVTAAARAAVPGATIVRVETDSEGAAYEAHMRKADGSFVTVKLDASFKVTNMIDGFGRGGRHGSPGGSGSGA